MSPEIVLVARGGEPNWSVRALARPHKVQINKSFDGVGKLVQAIYSKGRSANPRHRDMPLHSQSQKSRTGLYSAASLHLA